MYGWNCNIRWSFDLSVDLGNLGVRDNFEMCNVAGRK